MTDKLTTEAGQPWADNEHSQTAGARGPVLLQDYELVEKLAHFDRERIPERVVHAKGAGAKGTFKLENDMSKYTKADLFNGQGKETPILMRFSQVAGEKGYPDSVRDVRGFGAKFYTQEGNYDLVGNNTPVFFINDPLKFPDFIHSQKRDPQTNDRTQDMQWDFWAHSPESVHQVTYLMGDRGLPAAYQNMNGYGSHTYKWVNATGEQFWIKYHLLADKGVKNMTAAAAAKMAGQNTDFLQDELYQAIDQQNYPSWTMYVQILPYQAGLDYKWDIFDVTKVISHQDYPLIKVGQLTLTENPTNNFTDIEEAAFSPANLVPGIEPSPDKLLQGRLFAYKDTQRYRLGANFEDLPVNRPIVPVHNYERDGVMKADNQGAAGNYEPNGFDGPMEDLQAANHPVEVTGEAANQSYQHNVDHSTQAGDLYRLMSAPEQDRLIATIQGGLGSVKSAEVQRLETKQFYDADHTYGERVAKALNIPLDEILALNQD